MKYYLKNMIFVSNSECGYTFLKELTAGVIGTLLILAALIFISIHLLSSVKIKKALDDKFETYNRVQVTASQKLTDLNKSQAAADSSNESYVYYDEDGNEVSEEEVEKSRQKLKTYFSH